MLIPDGCEINSPTKFTSTLLYGLLLSLTGKIRSHDVEITADSSDILPTRFQASKLWVTIKTAI
jgi:hypothetical protein